MLSGKPEGIVIRQCTLRAWLIEVRRWFMTDIASFEGTSRQKLGSVGHSCARVLVSIVGVSFVTTALGLSTVISVPWRRLGSGFRSEDGRCCGAHCEGRLW